MNDKRTFSSSSLGITVVLLIKLKVMLSLVGYRSYSRLLTVAHRWGLTVLSTSVKNVPGNYMLASCVIA